MDIGKKGRNSLEMQAELEQRNDHIEPQPCLEPVFSVIFNKLLQSLQTAELSRSDCKQSAFII